MYISDQEAFGCPLSQIRAQEIENLESEKMCSGFKQTDLKNIKFTLLCIAYIYLLVHDNQCDSQRGSCMTACLIEPEAAIVEEASSKKKQVVVVHIPKVS